MATIGSSSNRLVIKAEVEAIEADNILPECSAAGRSLMQSMLVAEVVAVAIGSICFARAY